jgi:hypothetical protein
MKIDLVLGEKKQPGITGTSMIRVQSDEAGLGVSVTENACYVTRQQARLLARALMKWSVR